MDRPWWEGKEDKLEQGSGRRKGVDRWRRSRRPKDRESLEEESSELLELLVKS